MPIHRQSQMRPMNQGTGASNRNLANPSQSHYPAHVQYENYNHLNSSSHLDSDENFSFDEGDDDHINHTHTDQSRLPNYNFDERLQRAMLTPLPPQDRELNNAPLPPRHIYRRNAFNQELPPSRSSTLSVNRDTGNVSYSTFTNNSIHLNNSILRRAMQPQYNFNHHQQINPSFANSNESHTIRRENDGHHDNASTFNFLNDINRLSSQSLYNDLNQEQAREESRQLRHPLFHNHYDHSIPINLSRLNNINVKFNEFLTKRNHQGFLFNDYQSNQNPKKRHAIELDDDSTLEPFQEFQFPITRCCPCSFIKSGFVFNLKDTKPNEIPFNLSFISVDYNENKIRGNFHFEHLYLMNHWLSEISPNDNKFINISGNSNSFNFTGSIVDFEIEDLRYNSNILKQICQEEDQLNYSRFDNENARNNKNMKLIYKDCIIKKQLQKWKYLKPFKNLKVEDIISILTCNECLIKLQENYMLMKIYIDGGDQLDQQGEEEGQPILLCCVDRKTGDLELISTEGRQKSIVQEYNNHQFDDENMKFNHFPNDEEVIKLSMKCKKYVSPSLKFS